MENRDNMKGVNNTVNSARYFYERMLNYREESINKLKFYYGYENENVTLHRRGERDTYYTVYNDGIVYERSMKDGNFYKAMRIEDLKGNNFELFNTVQIVKSGYIVIDDVVGVKTAISKLYCLIDELENDPSKGKGERPTICGCTSWSSGLTDKMQFYSKNRIEVEVHTVKRLCESNVSRKYWDARCIPFIKDVKDDKAIHVQFITTLGDRCGKIVTLKESQEKSEVALQELLGYMKQLDIDCWWMECEMRSPVYV